MKKSKRNLIRLFVGILGIFAIITITINILVANNKARINEMAISFINSRVEGHVTLGSIEPSFFSTFPNIAITLNGITIRDSLWEHHQHELIDVSQIHIAFHWMSLFSGKPTPSEVILKDGSIHLYTDDCGHRNLNLIEQKKTTPKKEGKMPTFKLRNIRLKVENEILHSLHDIEAQQLDCIVLGQDSAVTMQLKLKSLVHGVGFNLEKGSYLKQKTLDGNFLITYYPKDKVLLEDVLLHINHHPFILNGAFYTGSDTMSYALNLATQQIRFDEAVSIMTEALQPKLQIIDIHTPFDVDATLSGKMARKVVPHITTNFTVTNASMETPLGQLEKCTYTGYFTNHEDIQALPGDANSKFTFYDTRVDWNKITLTSSCIEIQNLLNPLLSLDVQSSFEMIHLNDFSESSSMKLLKGQGKLDFTYRGQLNESDTMVSPALYGLFHFTDTEMKYTPRNLVFKNCSGDITFEGNDLLLNNLLATAGNTQLTMHGHIRNLMALLSLDPQKLVMDWTISTPVLYLGDFVSFVGESVKTVSKKTTKKNKVILASENIDRMLRDGTAKVKVMAGSLLYKKFYASNISATVMMAGNTIHLQHVGLNHAGGKVTIAGSLTNSHQANSVKMESTISHVDIPGLFKAFDNFGQDGITAENMRGQLSAKASIDLTLTDKAVIRENSMHGEIDFSIKNGQLINFDPLVKITTTALKKRDFSKVEFAELQNRFSVKGSAYHIPKMEIRANVVVLFVEGVYDTKLGTDMSIQIPLSNLSREENEIEYRTGKVGMNVRLRAKTGEDGKLNISWDPLNKFTKSRKDTMEEDTIPPPSNKLSKDQKIKHKEK